MKFTKKICLALFVLSFSLSTFATETSAADFQPNQALLDRLITEGASQRFMNVRIKTLADTIKSLVSEKNSEDNPAQFKITNQSADSFDFDGAKSGMYSEPPMCENFEIHFSGRYNKQNKYSPWEVGNIEVKFSDRSQCL